MSEYARLILGADSAQVGRAKLELGAFVKAAQSAEAAADEFTASTKAAGAGAREAATRIEGARGIIGRLVSITRDAASATAGMAASTRTAGTAARETAGTVGKARDEMGRFVGSAGAAAGAAAGFAGAARGAGAAAGETAAATGRARDELGRFVAGAKRAEGAAGGFGDAARSLGGELRKLLPQIAIAEAIRRLAVGAFNAAEGYNRATQRLALFTRTQAENFALQGRILQISQATNTAFEGNVTLYSRLAASASTLRASQGQLLATTQAVSAGLSISGATGAEAASAAIQLSQGLSAGVLRGEELNATLESAPRLARAIADGIGVGVGQLRTLGQEGRLTSRTVFLALLSQTRQLNDEMARLPRTVAQNWQNFTGAMGARVADLDRQIGATRWLSQLLEGGARFFSSPQGNAYRDALNETRPQTAIGAATTMNAAVTERQRIRGEIARVAAERRALDQSMRGNRWFGPDAIRQRQSMDRRLRDLSIEEQRQQGRIDATRRAFDGGIGIDPAILRREIEGSMGAGDSGGRRGRRGLTPAAESLRDALSATESALDTIIRAGDEFAALGDLVPSLAAARAGFGLRPGESATDVQRRIAGATVGGEFRQGASPWERELPRAAERFGDLLREQLARGLQDGIQQPLARMLATWRISVRSMGEALRDALVNAISAAVANAATRRLMEVLSSVGRGGGQGSTAGGTASQLLGSAASLAMVFGRPQGQQQGGGFFGLSLGGGGATTPRTPGTVSMLKKAMMSPLGSTALAGAAGLGIGALLGNSFGRGVGVAGGIAGGAMAGAKLGTALGTVVPGIGNAVGFVVGGALGALGGILGGNARERRQREERRLRDLAERDFRTELAARNADAGGDDVTAQRLRMEIQQRQELEEATRTFGARSPLIAALRATQAAQLAAIGGMTAGTYLAPQGFDAAAYRFQAGRPVTVTGNTIVMPAGTTEQQVDAFLTEIDRRARAQGRPVGSLPEVR